MSELNKYRLSLTGPEIDERLLDVASKADQSDLEALALVVEGKQDELVSGSNIKTINNESLLGSGNITIEGGGDIAIREIDYSDPTQWDTDEGTPTSAVIDDILANKYQFIHIINIPIEEGVTAETTLVTNSMIDIDNEPGVRYYYKFDEGDPDEGTSPCIEQYLFVHPEDDDAQMIVDQFDLGSDPSWGNIVGTLSDQLDLYYELTNIREVAEGKCKAFVATTSDTPALAVQTASVTLESFNDLPSGGVVITPSEVGIGDIVYVIETEYPDRWVSAIDTESSPNTMTLSILETTKVDLSNYVTLNTSQTISGQKTFQQTNPLGVSATGWNTGWFLNYSSRNLEFKHGSAANPSANYVMGYNDGFCPASDGGKDLGKSAAKWKDLYLNGNVVDGNGNTATAAAIVALPSSAVTGAASSTDGNVALFDGATGKVIKDSGKTLGTSVPVGAVFTDTVTTVTTSGSGSVVTSVTDDGSGSLTVTYGNVSAGGDVNGPASSTDGNVALFDGVTGKLIKDSGKTLGTSVPAGAVFTDTLPTITTSGSGNVVTGISIAGSTITQTKDVLVQMVLWDIVYDDNTTAQIPVCFATPA